MHISQLGVTAPALNGWSRPRCCGERGGESQRVALALALTCSVLSAPTILATSVPGSGKVLRGDHDRHSFQRQ